MRVTAIRTQTERKRQDSSASRAEKRRHQAEKMRVRGPIRPVSAVGAIADTAKGEKHLLNWQNRAILTPDVRRQATWGMSV